MDKQVGTAESKSVFSELLNGQASDAQHNGVQHEHYSQWLASHDYVIDGLLAGLVLVPVDGVLVTAGTLRSDSECFPTLSQLAEQQYTSQQPQVAVLTVPPNNSASIKSSSTKSPSSSDRFALLYPLRDKHQQLIAFVAMAIKVNTQQDLQKALTVVQWSVAGLEVIEYQHRLTLSDTSHQSIADRVDILARVLAETDYASASVRLVTELAVLMNCDRVSLGEYHDHKSTLKHLSHSAQFGKRMNIVRCIEQVMDECLDQARSIQYPPHQSNTTDDTSDVVLAHRQLSEQQGDACVLSIPVYLSGKSYGSLVLEGNSEQRWTLAQAQLCQSIASLVIPALEDKRLNDRPLWKKTLDTAAKQLGRLLGSGYLGRKVVVLLLLACAVFLSTAKGVYRLSADARIENAIQRAIVAPYDGYIDDAVVRAGDLVSAGQTLVAMDDKDLRLEKLKWISEQGKLNRQYQEAVAIRDRVKINVINAQLDQVQAQLQLVTSQMDRSKLTSPFDGVVVSGDLSQRLGSSVTKGEALLEVAPANNYRIRLLIKENRIADIHTKQLGRLYLSALPESSFDFELSKITPLTDIKDGTTYFIVEGELLSNSAPLQSGMEGVGKIIIDERRLVDIWTRDMFEWLRLKLWSWWG
jgi:hypothetical protein